MNSINLKKTETCCISNLPIHNGDKVKIVVVEIYSSPLDRTDNTFEVARPVSAIFNGIFKDGKVTAVCRDINSSSYLTYLRRFNNNNDIHFPEDVDLKDINTVLNAIYSRQVTTKDLGFPNYTLMFFSSNIVEDLTQELYNNNDFENYNKVSLLEYIDKIYDDISQNDKNKLYKLQRHSSYDNDNTRAIYELQESIKYKMFESLKYSSNPFKDLINHNSSNSYMLQKMIYMGNRLINREYIKPILIDFLNLQNIMMVLRKNWVPILQIQDKSLNQNFYNKLADSIHKETLNSL